MNTPIIKLKDPNLSYKIERGAGRGNNKTAPNHYGSAKKNIDSINATAERNLCGRLSFKGGVGSTLAKNAPDDLEALSKTFYGKLAKSKTAKKIINIFAKESLVGEAAFALVITCLLRPLVHLATPAKDESEKSKNQYRAASSIASGIMGFAFTLVMSKPINKAVEKIRKHSNVSEIIEKSAKELQKNNPKFQNESLEQITKRGSSIFKELAQRVHQPAFMPLRAMLTIALVPPLLGAMGIRKNKKTETPQETTTNLQNPIIKNNDSQIFQNFGGGIINANK